MEERSAGAVVYHESAGKRRYLLLLNSKRWDFPKGNMEKGETELDTVLREVGEETGFTDIKLAPGFRKVIEYYYRRDGKNVHKKVTYHLARTEDDKVRISFEHQAFGWFPFSRALDKASYDNSKAILKDAEKFLRASGGSPES